MTSNALGANTGAGSAAEMTRPDWRHLRNGALFAFVMAFATYVALEAMSPPPTEHYINVTPLVILFFAGLPLGLGSALLRSASIGWLCAAAGFAVAGAVIYGAFPELVYRVGEAPDLVERIRLGLNGWLLILVAGPLYVVGAAIGLLAHAMNRRDAAAQE